MATGDLNDPLFGKKVADALFGATSKPGLVDDVASVRRVMFGVPIEGVKGLVARVDELAERVAKMDDGRKFVITMLTIGASSLPGIASLIGVLILLARLIAGQPTGGTP